MTARPITVAGAGIIGLWQALTLARRGFDVTLVDHEPDPAARGASRHAGAMLAPWVEAESAPPLVRDFGVAGLTLWRETYPGVVSAGSLVVARPRDVPDLVRFAKLAPGHETLDRAGLAALEPALEGLFEQGLYYPGEAHVTTPAALAFLLDAVRQAGADVRFGEAFDLRAGQGERLIIDCRGLSARSDLKDLRGVRGERALLRCPEVNLQRPVRLLHPRHPLYVVPWGDGLYLAGATMIESEDGGPATVRSALEILGAAYALHPAFAEAQIVELSAGVRPSFPDNVPRARCSSDGMIIRINGAYRHGFLLAPVLAEAVANHLETGAAHPLLTVAGQ